MDRTLDRFKTSPCAQFRSISMYFMHGTFGFVLIPAWELLHVHIRYETERRHVLKDYSIHGSQKKALCTKILNIAHGYEKINILRSSGEHTALMSI